MGVFLLRSHTGCYTDFTGILMPTERKTQMENDPEEREDHEIDNPGLSTVIERNIRTIIQLRLKANNEPEL